MRSTAREQPRPLEEPYEEYARLESLTEEPFWRAMGPRRTHHLGGFREADRGHDALRTTRTCATVLLGRVGRPLPHDRAPNCTSSTT